MLKKNSVSLIGFVLGAMLAFCLVGCGDSGSGDPTGTGNGGNPGTDIAAKYRFTSNDHSSEWVGPKPEDETDITVTVGENTITWIGGTNGSFINVSTDSDKNLNGGSMIGTWAYLYSGNNKIGIAIAYSDLAGGIKQIFIGKRHVQALMMTVGASLLGVSGESVYSDITESARNISGEYNPEGKGDPNDPYPIGGDSALINAEGEAWINSNYGMFTGYIFYSNGDLRVLGGLVSGSDYNITSNELRTTEWYVSGGKLYGGGGTFNGDTYTVEGNTLIKYPGTAYSQTFTKTIIGNTSGNDSSIFETGLGEVWVDNSNPTFGYLFEGGNVYNVSENYSEGSGIWTAPTQHPSYSYSGTTLTHSGAGATFTLSVTGNILTWTANSNGETTTFTKKTGQMIAGQS